MSTPQLAHLMPSAAMLTIGRGAPNCCIVTYVFTYLKRYLGDDLFGLRQTITHLITKNIIAEEGFCVNGLEHGLALVFIDMIGDRNQNGKRGSLFLF